MRNFARTPLLCSWCDSHATQNLHTDTDQCCDRHYLMYFAKHAARITVGAGR